MKRTGLLLPILCISAVLMVITSVSFAGDKDDYINFCLQKESGQELRKELLSSQVSQDPQAVRDMVWKSTNAREGASRSLQLMEILLPDGDPANLDGVEGFIGADENLPKQVLAIESSLAAISFLVDIREPGALWLAHDIFKGLDRSVAFREMAGVVDQEEYDQLNRTLTQTRDLFDLLSNNSTMWKDPQERSLPLNLARLGNTADGVSPSVSRKTEGLVNLNKEGRITRSNSYYGWDTVNGSITRVNRNGSSGNGGDNSGSGGSGSSGSGGGASGGS